MTTPTPDQARDALVFLYERAHEFMPSSVGTTNSCDTLHRFIDAHSAPVMPAELSSNMRSPDGGPRFRVRDGGAWIDDDDFIFDATVRIGGDFGEGKKLAYAQWIADTLNAAASAHSAPTEPTAMQRYTDSMGSDDSGTPPIERLRFFCSLAMNGQDWIDVETFFDALASPPPAQPSADADDVAQPRPTP
jgi:hypothetical protein